MSVSASAVVVSWTVSPGIGMSVVPTFYTLSLMPTNITLAAKRSE